MASSFRENVKEYGKVIIGILVVSAVLHAAVDWFSAKTPQPQLATCSEPILISDCEFREVDADCTIQNKSNFTIERFDTYKVYSYDKTGLLLHASVGLGVDGLMPEQRKRVTLLKPKNVKRLIFCSLDPEHPSVKDKIVVVGK